MTHDDFHCDDPSIWLNDDRAAGGSLDFRGNPKARLHDALYTFALDGEAGYRAAPEWAGENP
jgi:hypothetical protein